MKNSLEISYSEFVLLTGLLAKESERETGAGLMALAHTIRNRLFLGEQIGNILDDPDFSGYTFLLDQRADLGAPMCLEIVSLLSSVLCGASDDLTEGARRFHRHDACPEWAKTVKPTALIGGRFYYV